VRRYGPNGSFWSSHPGVPKLPIHSWQIWNEPNLQIYSLPRASARRYTRLLRTVGRYIKKADPGAEVVTAGLPPSKLKTAIRLGRFIKGMYRAGGKAAFDTLAINAYAIDSRDLSRTVRSVRRIMRRYHDSAANIRITELGWATGGPKHRFNIGSARQGARILSTFGWIARNRARYHLRGLVYFQWRDQNPYPPMYKDMWGLHTGLLTLGGQAKPALGSFAQAAAPLR
jgi:polysaccharide biosynthesis protein PslG